MLVGFSQKHVIKYFCCRYTVVVLGIVALYSVLQLLKVIIIDYSSIAPESALAWTIFLCDQVSFLHYKQEL